MGRSLSTMSETAIPFMSSAPVAPLQMISTGMMDRFYQSNDEPAHVQAMATSLQASPLSQHRQELPSVLEDRAPDVGMSIGDYLAQSEMDDNLGSPTTMTAPLSAIYLSPVNAYGGLSTQLDSACPSLVSAPSAAEAGLPMTRENSMYDNGAAFNSFDMARIASSASYQTDGFHSQQDPLSFISSGQPSPSTKRQLTSDELFAYTGAGLAPPPEHQYPATATGETLIPGSTAMERSISSTSNMSTASNLERRAKETHQKVIENGLRNKIAPKPVETTKASHSTRESAKKESKVAVAKNNSYRRPKHPRVYCDMCDDQPEGFRGEHELRRHTSAKHEGRVVKFVCRDPATAGIKTSIKAINPLSNCKACNAGKQYGAYYNAAAHLRRTHFKPKSPRNSRKSSSGEESRRAGTGGGLWPPMEELKPWWTQVVVDRSKNDDGTDSDTNDYANSDEVEMSGYDMEEAYGASIDMPPESFPELANGTEASILSAGAVPMPATAFEFPYSSTSPMPIIQGFDAGVMIYGSPVIPDNFSAAAYHHDMARMREEIYN
jgi:hypothetical protein